MIPASATRRLLPAVLLLSAAVLLLLLPSCASMRKDAAADRIYRMAMLSPGGATPTLAVLKQRLAEQGYAEGRNLTIETYYADGQLQRLPELAAEAARSNPDVIFVASGIGALAAAKATSTIPIVFAGVFDPRTVGIVSDLDRPGGNVTGTVMDIAGTNLPAEWVALLRQATPGVDHIAVLASQGPLTENWLLDVRGAAREAGVKLDVRTVGDAASLDASLKAIADSPARGLIVLPDPFFTPNREKLARFAAGQRLPSMYFFKVFADAGGLMSYGASQEESYRGAADYVARILRGEKPGEMPVVRPQRAELVVNRKAAKGMGIMIPDALLKRADKVID